MASVESIKKKEKLISRNYVDRKSRRIRVKTPEEIAFLEEQFAKDPSWTRKTVKHCKTILGLSTNQIYKWGFDKKNLLQRYNRPDNNCKIGNINNRNKRTESIIRLNNRLRKNNDNQEGFMNHNRRNDTVLEGDDTHACEELSTVDYNLEVKNIFEGIQNATKEETTKDEDDASQTCGEEGTLPSKSTLLEEKTWIDKIWEEPYKFSDYVATSNNCFYFSEFAQMERLNSYNTTGVTGLNNVCTLFNEENNSFFT
ncbi:unnamed protein product [Moneuplotes crassus]|uniref:Homeobox domain-containing protein n=1 Tax=Euplotes crassus TaxID=5936 RepID=A0AAD1XHN9_EUPCR|nr:unnamed protein product [Moneuplotes crassus]